MEQGSSLGVPSRFIFARFAAAMCVPLVGRPAVFSIVASFFALEPEAMATFVFRLGFGFILFSTLLALSTSQRSTTTGLREGT